MDSEIKKLTDKLSIIKDRFSVWCDNDPVKIESKLMMREYNKLMCVAHIKKQLATLKYINS